MYCVICVTYYVLHLMYYTICVEWKNGKENNAKENCAEIVHEKGGYYFAKR